MFIEAGSGSAGRGGRIVCMSAIDHKVTTGDFDSKREKP
jgi:hypothetical protein